MLTNPSDISTGVKGYVKCDISVSAKGDAVQPGQKASDADEQIEKYDVHWFLFLFSVSSEKLQEQEEWSRGSV